jgi:hypothetical protein
MRLSGGFLVNFKCPKSANLTVPKKEPGVSWLTVIFKGLMACAKASRSSN